MNTVNMQVVVEVAVREARCDFCGQNKLLCWQAKNSDETVLGADICEGCVMRLASSLGMMKFSGGGFGAGGGGGVAIIPVGASPTPMGSITTTTDTPMSTGTARTDNHG